MDLKTEFDALGRPKIRLVDDFEHEKSINRPISIINFHENP